MKCEIQYNGATLTVTTTDEVMKASSTQTYTVNIPTTIGGSTGYVGFTGGTGDLDADIRVLSWTFTS